MIGLLVVLIVFGAVLWMVDHYVPMEPVFRYGIRLVVVLILIGYGLRLLGVAWPLALRLGP